MKLQFDFSNPFKLLFLLSALAVSIILPFASKDAGITEDEPQHLEHGKKICAWYTGEDKTVGESPFDAKGQWKYYSEGTASKTAINIYGGFFDLVAEVFHRTVFRSLDEYESKHILSAFFGALLFIFTALIAQRISESWAVALLTLVIATFTPRLFGYSLNNPKDIPLATFFAFSILQIISFLKELPRIRTVRLVLLALSFSLAMAVRSGAMILIFYFLLFLAFYFLLQILSGEVDKKYIVKTFALAIAISIAGYLGTSLFWPWAMNNPLLNPLRSMSVFKNFNTFIINELFEGKWIGTGRLPWYFVPKWIYITLPVVSLSGLALFLILIPKFIRKENWRISAYALLFFSAVFPVLSIILGNSNIYNSARHITFVIPSIIVLASLGWAEVFKTVRDIYLKLSVGIAFLIILSEPVLFIFHNHPVQAMYFSPLIGGTKAAFKNFEMDYWGVSIKPAFDWIEKHDSTATAQNKGRIRLWYGEQAKLNHFTEKSSRFVAVLANEDSRDWDYFIQMPAEGKFAPDIVYHWPPKGTVCEIMADSAPLCAIIKNYRLENSSTPAANNAAPVAAAVSADPAANAFNEGMSYYGKKNFNAAVLAFKRAHQLAPKNMLMINNVVACYNELNMFDEALEFGAVGIKVDPNFELLKNNLRETLKAKQVFKPDANYYINLSYNYYMQREFEKCIASSKMILKYQPNSYLAWNNICSAYNELHQYAKAVEACDKGLKLAPKDELLKNNKAAALQAKGK